MSFKQVKWSVGVEDEEWNEWKMSIDHSGEYGDKELNSRCIGVEYKE